MQNGNKVTKNQKCTYSTRVFVTFVDFDPRARDYPEAARWGGEFLKRSAPCPARAAAAKTLRLIINQRPSKIGGEGEDLSSAETEG